MPSAVGTDTSGSLRIPAAFCGITGFKPTFGRVPKSGVVPLAYTLDHSGPLARTVADCALLLEILAVTMPKTRTVQPNPSPTTRPRSPVTYTESPSASTTSTATATTLIVLAAESAAYHQPTLRSRYDDRARGSRVVLAAGSTVSGADYLQAQWVRHVAQRKMAELFTEVELVVTPTGHLGAPRIDAMEQLNPVSVLAGLHPPYWNALGNPTVAVPIGLTTDGVLLSMSISGKHFDEAPVLRAGDALPAPDRSPPDTRAEPKGIAMSADRTWPASAEENAAIAMLEQLPVAELTWRSGPSTARGPPLR